MTWITLVLLIGLLFGMLKVQNGLRAAVNAQSWKLAAQKSMQMAYVFTGMCAVYGFRAVAVLGTPILDVFFLAVFGYFTFDAVRKAKLLESLAKHTESAPAPEDTSETK